MTDRKRGVALRRLAVSPWTHVAFAASDSEPGVEHEVKRHSDGRLGCSCLAYRFARGTAKTCKHIVGLSRVPAQQPQAAQPRQAVVTARVTVGAEVLTFRRAVSFGPLEVL